MSGCFWGIYRAYTTVLYFRALPSIIEKNYAKSVLRNGNPDNYDSVLIIAPDHEYLGLRTRYDEFGFLTTTLPCFRREFLAAILRDMGVPAGMEYFKRHTIFFSFRKHGVIKEDTDFVIDMREMFDEYPEYLDKVKNF